MKDRPFVDSNVVLYLLDLNGSNKKEIASSLILDLPFISPQVVFECLNVCLKKLKMDRTSSTRFLNELIASTFMQDETEQVVNSALRIFNRYLL